VNGHGLRVTDMRDGLAPGTAVDVGIRPEDLRLAPSDREAALRLDVDFVEELGATQLFHGRIAGSDFVVQAPTGLIAPETRRLAVAVDPGSVHLFDARTGERLGRAEPAESRAALATTA